MVFLDPPADLIDLVGDSLWDAGEVFLRGEGRAARVGVDRNECDPVARRAERVLGEGEGAQLCFRIHRVHGVRDRIEALDENVSRDGRSIRQKRSRFPRTAEFVAHMPVGGFIAVLFAPFHPFGSFDRTPGSRVEGRQPHRTRRGFDEILKRFDVHITVEALDWFQRFAVHHKARFVGAVVHRRITILANARRVHIAFVVADAVAVPIIGIAP